MVGNVQVSQGDPETYVHELGATQPYPPKVNMIKVINSIDTYKGSFHEGKHLKFPIESHPAGNHLVVSMDTVGDVNCMNEITYNELFFFFLK